ncbi:hypothetical protein [Streptomyces sp. AM 2-1-1]|uniref:hypothetical protein n=1 Tax=Streptomyces sp. AM 2-1-1 TaxID=3028709 RepID=UPI0023B96552|nr:hypothetical protein [Streptomyces sp. AM 2-1-1]WEH41716.1 hypothetical protein PZB77_20685 [Streptomyces sp. AM 2-1-1]
MTAVRLVAAVGITWGALVVLLLAPSALPASWQYYVYSPASVGLWILTMLVAPVVACFVTWPWIRSGRK